MSTVTLVSHPRHTPLRVVVLSTVAGAACLAIIPVAVSLGAIAGLTFLVEQVWQLDIENVVPMAVPLMVIVLAAGLGGALWGLAGGRLAGVARHRTLAVATGVAYGLIFPATLAALGAFESSITQHGRIEATSIPNIHLLYVTAWSLGMVVMLAAPALALGGALRSWRLALWLGLSSGIGAGLAFVVVDGLLFTAGWRVGDPDFPDRPTMTIAVLLGFLAATAVSGLVTGLGLRRKIE